MKAIFTTILIAGLLGIAPAAAQVRCDPSKSATDCWLEAMDDVPTPEAVKSGVEQNGAALEEEEGAELLAKPTGVDTGGLNLASNTKNFLPLLALSGLLGEGEDLDGDGVYVFDLNFLIPGLAEDNNSQIQAAVNSQPKLSDAVKEALPAEGRDDLVSGLEGKLGQLDDYTLSYTYNWNDRRHGRGFNHYRNRFASLTRAVSRNFERAPVDPLRSLLDLINQDPELRGDPDLLTQPFDQISDAKKRQALKAKVESSAELARTILDRNRQQLALAGLGSFADLVNNQPQLHFSASQRFRAPVVGGDETSIKITYEWGGADLNHALAGGCNETLDTPDTSALEQQPGTLDTCLATFGKYVKDHKSDIESGRRLSFSGEYLDIDEETVELPDQDITGLTLAGARKVILSAGWSQSFGKAAPGRQPLRLDLVANYEDVSDDPMRQDRGTATLTITKQFGDLAVPFGIVYANHGEFLPEVDEKLSAHIGLKFNLFSPNAANP